MPTPNPLNKGLQNIGAPLVQCVLIFAKRDFEALKAMEPSTDAEMAMRRVQDVVVELSRAMHHIGPLDEEWGYEFRELYNEIRAYRRDNYPERWRMCMHDDGPNPLLFD